VISELVIFDCDGVLVDSERLSARVMQDMARPLGLGFTEERALAFIQGRKVADWVAELGALAGREAPAGFVPEFRERCTAAFDRDLVAVEGIGELLDGLDLPYCCASSAPMEKIRHVLGRTGLEHYFPPELLYSAYDVGVWKPDPGLFLHAARAQGVPPGRCAVIEDSAPGVRAGVRAGMTVFGYAPGGHAAFADEETGTGEEPGATAEVDAAQEPGAAGEPGAVTVFGSMRELPELLRQWRAALPERTRAVPAVIGGGADVRPE
jgi:beta-phosphoglucomutase-like phosphatase (HAD superfamily)